MTPYGFRIVGGCEGERRSVGAAAAFRAYAKCAAEARVDTEGYLSAFTFGEDFLAQLKDTHSTKGFKGACGADWIWWDLDYANNLPEALKASRKLLMTLCHRFALDEDDILVFFSGSKGFHVGLPTALWSPEPAVDFHRITRHFAEQVAGVAGIQIDHGIYDKVRAFRAPNSRHPKSGLHKRRLTAEEVLHLDAEAIVRMAEKPEPFDLPMVAPGKCDWNLAADWNEATRAVRAQAEVAVQRRQSGSNPTQLNRLTMEFIRNGATTGDRHRRLYSAAANLAEFDSISQLAHALLREPALDSGLPPSDVRRQIDCGLADGKKGGGA